MPSQATNYNYKVLLTCLRQMNITVIINVGQIGRIQDSSKKKVRHMQKEKKLRLGVLILP